MNASELTPGMTLQDLVLDCSERWGQASEVDATTGIPTDQAVLDKIVRKINAGYREFLTANPKWTFLERQVQVLGYPDGSGPENIAKDPARYRLPSYVASSPRFDWHFVGDSRPRTVVMNVAVDIVRKRRALYSRQTGIPTIAGVGSIEPGDGLGGAASGYEVVFWPAPSLTYLMENTFRLDAHQLRDMDERHVGGRTHDRTLVAFCDHEWFKDDAEDPQQVQQYAAQRDAAFQKSVLMDSEMRTRQRGSMSLERVNQFNRRKTHRYLGRVLVDGVAIGPSQ